MPNPSVRKVRSETETKFFERKSRSLSSTKKKLFVPIAETYFDNVIERLFLGVLGVPRDENA